MTQVSGKVLRRGATQGGTLRAVVVALAVSLLSPASVAQACAFDMVKPERTAIDWIVQADQLVLARSKTDNPFAFDITRVLRGGAAVPPVPFLVDSTSRRSLAKNPEAAFLFARLGDGPWRRVALVDDRFRPVLDTAIHHRADWKGAFPTSRQSLAVKLQADPDPRLRALAIAEFDKMPYEMLRRSDLSIPAEDLIGDLWTIEGYPLQAVRVLMLGLSANPVAHAEIRSFITRTASWSWANNLGAFAAALIEIDGVAGVDTLARRLLLDPAQPLDKLDQVLMAFSVQNAVAPQEVRRAISEATSALMSARPAAAGLVARQFANQSDWSQVATLMPLLQDGLLEDTEDMLAVYSYVAQARQDSGARPVNPKMAR